MCKFLIFPSFNSQFAEGYQPRPPRPPLIFLFPIFITPLFWGIDQLLLLPRLFCSRADLVFETEAILKQFLRLRETHNALQLLVLFSSCSYACRVRNIGEFGAKKIPSNS